jgi:hypothetical protein
MIVIAVAAALFAYAWVVGYLDFLTVKVDQAVMVQAIHWDGTTVTAYVQNVGPSSATLSNLYIDEVLDPAYTPVTLAPGETQMLQSTGIYDGTNPQVTVKVTTADGNIFMLKKTVTTGSGGVIVEPPTVTQVSSTDSGFSGVQAGDLLVVMPNTRIGSWTGDSLTCTATGYTTVEVAAYRDDDSDRRAVAILIKTADGSETGTVSCSWGSGASTYATIYQIYRGATTWAPNGESGEASNGGGATSTSIPTISGLATSTIDNILTIGALVVRDNPGTVTITNLGSQDSATFNNCYTFTEFSYGAAVTETDMSWTTARLATGILLQIACAD